MIVAAPRKALIPPAVSTAFVALLVALAAHAQPAASQSYPAKPLRMIVPFSPGAHASSKQGSRLRDANVRESCAAAGIRIAAADVPGYPNKPLRMIVPFSPGGPSDLVARVLSERLTKSLGQPVVVINRDGAGTILGADMAAKSPADGYTLLMGSAAMTINASVRKNMPYDLLRDLAPVSLVFVQPLVLIVHPSVPARNVRELIALTKARPGKLSYGSSGVATSMQLTAELFNTLTGVAITHIPYKGVAPALVELIAGQIDMSFAGISPALPHIRSGKVRALAITSSKRSPTLPEVPTFAEAGVADFEVFGWYGVMVPAGTAQEIIARLNADIVNALKVPEIRERFATEGGEAHPTTPAAFHAFISAELRRWGDVARRADIRAQ
jgi:tripartite-type tricarboxylate transporter receptor subunit TctC